MKRSDWEKKENFTFEDLVEIVKILRSPDGCPWDRKQSHKSLRTNLVEEAYEVCEGIDTENSALLCEELGDVLLQVVFHAGIGEEGGEFSTEDVIGGICRKMIRRHPHVFAGKSVDPEKLQDSWDEIKKQEKGDLTPADSLSRIAKTLPALKRSEKFIEKNAPETPPVPGDASSLLGFRLYGLCREAVALGIDPEEALQGYLKEITKIMHKL